MGKETSREQEKKETSGRSKEATIRTEATLLRSELSEHRHLRAVQGGETCSALEGHFSGVLAEEVAIFRLSDEAELYRFGRQPEGGHLFLLRPIV